MFYEMILYGIAGLIGLYGIFSVILRYKHGLTKAGDIVVEIGNKKSLNFYGFTLSSIILIGLSIRNFVISDYSWAIRSFLFALIISNNIVIGFQKSYLCKNGFVVAPGFIPWNYIYNYSWKKNKLILNYFHLGNEKLAYQKHITFEESDLDHVKKLLAKKTKNKDMSESTTTAK